jgi:hypothetical protein
LFELKRCTQFPATDDIATEMARVQQSPVLRQATLNSNIGSEHPSMMIASFLKTFTMLKPSTTATPLALLINVFLLDEKDNAAPPKRAFGNFDLALSATVRHLMSLVFNGKKSSDPYANLSISTPLTSTAAVCATGITAFMPMD